MTPESVTWAVGRRRLLELADLVEKTPRPRFSFATWVGDDWGGAPDLSCGTTACAIGWATTMPELREAGLHLARRHGRGEVELGNTGLGPLTAARHVFGVSQNDAEVMFVPHELNDYGLCAACDSDDCLLSSDADPVDVAANIRAVVSRIDAWKGDG